MVNTDSYKKIKYKAKEPTAVIPLLKCINTFWGKSWDMEEKKNNLLKKEGVRSFKIWPTFSFLNNNYILMHNINGVMYVLLRAQICKECETVI